MSNGIICDRCGEVIKHSTWDAVTIAGEARSRLDLCIACFTEFKSFMGIAEETESEPCLCQPDIECEAPVTRERKYAAMIDFADVRRDRAKDVNDLASRLNLKPREAAVLQRIDSVCDVVTGTSIITLDTLAKQLDLTPVTISRLVRKLEDKGALVVMRERRQGRNLANRYSVMVER